MPITSSFVNSESVKSSNWGKLPPNISGDRAIDHSDISAYCSFLLNRVERPVHCCRKRSDPEDLERRFQLRWNIRARRRGEPRELPLPFSDAARADDIFNASCKVSYSSRIPFAYYPAKLGSLLGAKLKGSRHWFAESFPPSRSIGCELTLRRVPELPNCAARSVQVLPETQNRTIALQPCPLD